MRFKSAEAQVSVCMPELAVLMAYVKIHLYEQLVGGDFPKTMRLVKCC